MQFQADISGVDVICPESPEATARGAANLAGLACGFYGSLDELRATKGGTYFYTPRMSAEQRAELLDGWKKAVNKTRES